MKAAILGILASLLVLGCTVPLWSTAASAVVPVPFFLWSLQQDAGVETPDAGGPKR